MSAQIESLGHYVPETIIDNDYFVSKLKLDTSDEWIQSRSGIKKRRFVDNNTSSADIGYQAALNCLSKSNKTIKDIDLILVATSTPDHLAFPSTACIIQEKLNAQPTPAFDISAACSGFCFALSTAQAYLLNPLYNTILVIGVDCLSTITNMQDRATSILFADGAGAAIVTKSSKNNGIIYSKMFSDGALGSILSIPKGGSKYPINNSILNEKSHFIQMQGKAVFKTAITTIVPAIKKALAESNITPQDIAYLICHQANIRIIQTIGDQLNIDQTKLICNVEQYGNTSAASIPLAMSEHHEKTPFKKGDILVLAGFGAGFTWGITILKW